MMNVLVLYVLIAVLGNARAYSDTSLSQTGHELTSAESPRLTLSIDPSFKAMRPLAFALEFTDVDRRIFVKADASKNIVDLIVVQFEAVRPGSSFKFLYRPKPPIEFGTSTYRFGAYVYDDIRTATAAPTMESARTRAFLAAQGYHLPRLFRTARLARVADTNGKHEIIIFYDENVDSAYPSGTLPHPDADGDQVLDAPAAQALFVRLKSAIRPSVP